MNATGIASPRRSLWLPGAKPIARRFSDWMYNSFSFRWTGADRSGHSCKTCGCSVPPNSICTTCCGTSAPTAWDVDLTGLTYTFTPEPSGFCATDSTSTCTDNCSSVPAVYTVNYHGTGCLWTYITGFCFTCDCYNKFGDLVTTAKKEMPLALNLSLITSFGNCLFNLSVGTSGGSADICGFGGGIGFTCSGGAGLLYRSSSFAPGSCGSSYTLSLFGSYTLPDCSGYTGCCCLTAIPSSVTITAA